ncbi:hypothetical protein C9439_04310 [archaeon SCG-AAA382B04]|nr:hypothetical protein C9439_04310 [archaeon SCG-AAA382B04]
MKQKTKTKTKTNLLNITLALLIILILVLALAPSIKAASDQGVVIEPTSTEWTHKETKSNPDGGDIVRITYKIKNTNNYPILFTKDTKLELYVNNKKRDSINFKFHAPYGEPYSLLALESEGETTQFKQTTFELSFEAKPGTKEIKTKLNGSIKQQIDDQWQNHQDALSTLYESYSTNSTYQVCDMCHFQESSLPRFTKQLK